MTMRRPCHDDRGNGMFEDQLLLVSRIKNHRILVEGANAARQLHATHQINCDVVALFTGSVEKGILNVLLRRLVFHLPISLYFYLDAAPMSFREGNWGSSVTFLILQYGVSFGFSTWGPRSQ